MEQSLDKKLQGFQLIAQEKLQAIICSIPNAKDLILEQTLIKPLEHICAASWLKLKGIQRIYKFNSENAIARQDNVQVFLISSNLEIFRKVLNQIHEHERKNPSDTNSGICNFHVIFVPNCFMCFSSLLEQEGLYGIVQLHRFNWDFIHLDNGAMSMELPQVFDSVFVHQDTSFLPSIAQSLRILQMACGKPDVIVTYGNHSRKIIDMIDILGPWPMPSNTVDNESDFNAMVIIDRDKDYPSCLLSPAIYSGLLLEVFNCSAGEIEVQGSTNKIASQKLKIFQLQKDIPTASTEAATTAEKSRSTNASVIRLSSMVDEIYGENRYKHFSQASSLVRAQAKTIGFEVQNLNKMKLDEMHDYVARKLPKLTELKTKVMKHLNASEKVIEMLAGNFQKVQSLEEEILNNMSRKKILAEIDELLTTDGQKYNTLRMMCLAHLSMGLSSDELTPFIRNYCNYFGYRYVHVFHQLAKAGLLPFLEEEKVGKAKILSNLSIPKFQQTDFQANANRLKLLVSSAGADGNDPRKSDAGAACPSYVFNGLYIPLIAQLSSILVKSNSADELAQRLGVVEGINVHLSGSASINTTNIKQIAASIKLGDTKDVFPLRKRNLFVFVIGGVTYSEIGACELIGRLTDSQIVVASNNIVSGSDIIASAF